MPAKRYRASFWKNLKNRAPTASRDTVRNPRNSRSTKTASLRPNAPFLSFNTKHPQALLSLEHVRSLHSTRLACINIRPALLNQHLHNLIVPLENSTGNRALSPIVDSIDVRTLVYQRPYGLRIAVVGGEHQQGVAFVVCEVRGDAGGEVLQEGGRVAGAGEVEEFAGEFEGFWGELRAV